MGHEIQAKPYNILRHFYIRQISSKILTTKFAISLAVRKQSNLYCQ